MAQLLPAYAPLLLIRLLIATLLLAKIVVGQSPGPAPVVTCSVELKGNGAAGPKKASILCSGGSIKAAADDPAVLRTLQSNSKGVAWQSNNCGMEAGSCMLVICGVSGTSTEPVQVKLTVNEVIDKTEERWAAVCIAGDTKAVLQVGVQGVLMLESQATQNTSPPPPTPRPMQHCR
jgi:hypothetical protein